MASKYVYNEVLNRWFSIDANGSSSLYKKSETFKDGYDDPTYMTFKIEFGDWGASILDRGILNLGTTMFNAQRNNYDALPIGLLNCPYEGCPNADAYWQNSANTDSAVFNDNTMYSAFRYLRSRNEDARAEYLYYFVNGLLELQHDTPYLFQKISGIDQLERHDPKSGQRLKDAKITLQCYEGLNLKIRTLMELYRKAAWDDVYQRWILPENMREFKMIIYIFERRTFQDVIGSTIVGPDNVSRTAFQMKYDSLNANIPVKAYECCPCEFDISGSQSWASDYSSSTENQAEQSKIVINVKNVKSFYKNGLLSDTLHKSYINGGSSVDQSISQKIDSLMIYDLVETVERQPDFYDSTYGENVAQTGIGNTTLNGVRALFLNKTILLENEDANMNTSSNYVWGHSYSGNISQSDGAISQEQYNQLTDEEKSKYTFDGQKYVASMNEHIIDAFFGSAFSSVFNGSQADLKNYRSVPRQTMQSLYYPELLRLLSSYVKGIIYGVKMQLFDQIYFAPIVSKAINNGRQPMSSLSFFEQYKTLRPIKNFKLEPARTDVDRVSADAKPYVPQYMTYIELDKERNIEELQYRTLDNERDVPAQSFANLDDPRDLPTPELISPDGPRDIADQAYNTLDDYRDLPEISYQELDSERDKVAIDYSKLEDTRAVPDQKYQELESERDLPEVSYQQLDKQREQIEQTLIQIDDPRELPEVSYISPDDARDLPEQKMISVSPERSIPKQEYEKLLAARELPGMQYATLEDVRDIPTEKLVSLKDAAYRAVPQFSIDKQEILDVISKATTEHDMKLVELDMSNKENEDIILQRLKDNQVLMALDQYSPEDEKDVKIAKLAKMLALDTDAAKNQYITDIEEKRKTLISLTEDVVRKLPDMDMYELQQEETDNGKMSMISLTDLEYIHNNLQLITMSETEYRELSFGTLMSLDETLARHIDDTQQLIGLSKAAMDVSSVNDKQSGKEDSAKNRRLGSKSMKMISMVEENEKAAQKKNVIVF